MNNSIDYEFSAQQRMLLDRYLRLLGTLVPLYDKAGLVFERRRKSGHQRAELMWDTRLNRAGFLQGHIGSNLRLIGDSAKKLRACVADLETFASESLDITRRTSRNEPLANIDLHEYTLFRAGKWSVLPPTSVKGLVNELASRFYGPGSDLFSIRLATQVTYDDSFGLKAVFTKIMGWQSCACHSAPTVAEELFRGSETTPQWDTRFSSSDPLVRGAEYQADVTGLFDDFIPLNTQMGFSIGEVTVRIDAVKEELGKTTDMNTLGNLNSRAGTALEVAKDALLLLEKLEAWVKP
ncbi:hypothetical protein [Pseudomonas sp. NPDC089534]|uniref:hypothetical protein n=1 Tax=Pseudomonas sp. NPDC089534 TaxID=3364468 RepID=UPI00382FE65D